MTLSLLNKFIIKYQTLCCVVPLHKKNVSEKIIDLITVADGLLNRIVNMSFPVPVYMLHNLQPILRKRAAF